MQASVGGATIRCSTERCRPGTARRHAPGDAQMAAFEHENLRPTLVGRAAELGTLGEVLDAARDGRGGAVVVHGEPGIGKTALLEYIIASARDFQVLRTVGNEAERELPFAA